MSKRLLQFVCIVVLCNVSAYPQIVPNKDGGFLGSAFGTGRACSGHLTITPQWITWRMHFMSCKRVPYKVIKQEQDGQHKLVVYELKTNPQCPFQVITIEQRPELDQGVEALGFSKIEDYKNDRWDMDCVLF